MVVMAAGLAAVVGVAADMADSSNGSGMVIRVLVGAPAAVVRTGLEALLGTHPSLEVVGSAADFATLEQQIAELQPEVVLLDLTAPTETTLALLTTFNADTAASVIVVLTDQIAAPWLWSALRSQVRAFLPRDATAPEIIAAVEAAASGLVVLHPDLLEDFVDLLPPLRPDFQPSTTQVLTQREREVLAMLAEGLSNKEIARRLQLSEHTVKFHIAAIFSKLNVSSRTEAVTLGLRRGLILL